MASPSPGTMSKDDLDVLRLIESANQGYKKYLEAMEIQAKLALTEQPPIQAERNWDHPLGLVIRKDRHGLVEPVARGV